MRLIAYYGYGPGDQYPSIGCSIKWRDNELDEVPAGKKALAA